MVRNRIISLRPFLFAIATSALMMANKFRCTHHCLATAFLQSLAPKAFHRPRFLIATNVNARSANGLWRTRAQYSSKPAFQSDPIDHLRSVEAKPPLTTPSEPEEITALIKIWRDHPTLNPTVNFPSWVVSVSGKSIQTILNSPITQPFLATRWETLEDLHLRLKVVRDMPADEENSLEAPVREKMILLHPNTPSYHNLPTDVQALLKEYAVERDGPVTPMTFTYKQFTANYILSSVLPKEIHPVPSAFETIGHVAHLNLRPQHLPYGKLIGQVLLETLPNIETVIHKVGEVNGPFRTYDFAVIAGRPETNVELTESGTKLHFDLADVYWCSRLSEERQRLLRAEIKPGQIVADAFCGVGALCLQAAAALNCTILANDWNPKATAALKANAERNGVADRVTRVTCGDAYDFLMDLGLKTKDVEGGEGTIETELPDHVVLNFPLESPSFLGALRWWPVPRFKSTADPKLEANRAPRVHVYTFARADPETDRSAEDVAVDSVADNLVPLGNSVKRLVEMNEEYNCNVRVHPVRDVAPGKTVMCVSFSATTRLLRSMQGDFR